MAKHVVAAVDDIPPGARKLVEVERPRRSWCSISAASSSRSTIAARTAAAACARASRPGWSQSDGPGRLPVQPPGRDHPLPLARLGVRHPHRPVLVRSRQVRARRYPVSVEAGTRLVDGPYVGRDLPVSVENDYVVVEA